jgi:acyl carrier protein
VLLFLTGVSILFYILCRWDRAKSPILGIVGAGFVLGIVGGVKSIYDATSYEPSPEEVAAKVKPLILEEWKKSPELGEAKIQGISLVAKGGGRYSGFIEVTLDRRAERLTLEVVLDRKTMRWELGPATPDTVERVVREVIADLLKVDAAVIPMDRPMSDPPLKADDLDLVEIVMEVEERLGIEIADDALERQGGRLEKGLVWITPNQLVSVARKAPKAQQSKRKK